MAFRNWWPFIHSVYFYSASSVHYYIQRRSRHSTDTVPKFHAEEPQATVNEGLAQGPYVAARAGVEVMTLRTKGVGNTNEPPTPHDISLVSLQGTDWRTSRRDEHANTTTLQAARGQPPKTLVNQSTVQVGLQSCLLQLWHDYRYIYRRDGIKLVRKRCLDSATTFVYTECGVRIKLVLT